ncbi:hypothetical protein HY624_03950 [Candidatus Uhrbacteria bacterium]|nr:hypothetical protein [Candidatus Uhrbacteria bacterium]
MIRPSILVFVCLVLPLVACTALQNAEVDTAPLFPGFDDPSLRASIPRADPTLTPALEDMARDLAARELELRVELLSYELSRALIEGRSPALSLSPAALDEAFAALFERPLDPSSPIKASWLKTFNDSVSDMSMGEITLVQTTSADPVFAKHPSAKKEWTVAHVFIRVEKVPKTGAKKIFGIVLSAPEPKEEEGWTTELEGDEEEIAPPSETLTPLGQ